jgi:hypothetical protein
MASCSQKDEQFCKCLKAGDELNAFSSKLFNKDVTPKLQKEMQKLRATKTTACKNYQTMDGKKMLELKSECR